MRAREILFEHVVNVTSKEQMAAFSKEVFELISITYKAIGGHLNFKTPEDLLGTDFWKLIRRDGRIVAACIYKLHQGRKRVAIAHDGTPIGKSELSQIFREDVVRRCVWAEVSGSAAKFALSMGFRPIPNEHAEAILGKPILAKKGRFKYERIIAGHAHEKMLVGYPDGRDLQASGFDAEEVLF